MEDRIVRLEADVAYLRSDIAEIRADLRALRAYMDTRIDRLESKFETRAYSLKTKLAGKF
jgi:uncharacterized protein (UPF0335 family)